MKRVLIGLLAASMLMTGTNALARGGHGGFYGPPPPPYRGHYWSGHHHDYSGAYLIGGLALGAVLTDALIDRGPTTVYVEPRPAPRVIFRERPVTTVVVTQPRRSLLRDLNGKCYEISRDDADNELRTQLPASECDW